MISQPASQQRRTKGPMGYHIEKSSIQEAQVFPLYARSLCTWQSPRLFSDPLSAEDLGQAGGHRIVGPPRMRRGDRQLGPAASPYPAGAICQAARPATEHAPHMIVSRELPVAPAEVQGGSGDTKAEISSVLPLRASPSLGEEITKNRRRHTRRRFFQLAPIKIREIEVKKIRTCKGPVPPLLPRPAAARPGHGRTDVISAPFAREREAAPAAPATA